MEPECLDSGMIFPGISCLFLDRVLELYVLFSSFEKYG